MDDRKAVNTMLHDPPTPAGAFDKDAARPFDGGAKPGAPREGRTARAIEEQTSQLPSDTFLWAALGSMGVSMMLRAANQKQASLFVGQWASPLLLFGVYNKLVKLGGSDSTDRTVRR